MEQAKIEISTIKPKRVIDLLPEWEEREHNISMHSSKSYFYLPFKEVHKNDIVEIDCKYIESMRVVQGYYYLNIPFTFCDRNPMTSMFAKNEKETILTNVDAIKEENENENENGNDSDNNSENANKDNQKRTKKQYGCYYNPDRLQITCRLFHSHSMAIQVTFCLFSVHSDCF